MSDIAKFGFETYKHTANSLLNAVDDLLSQCERRGLPYSEARRLMSVYRVSDDQAPRFMGMDLAADDRKTEQA